MGRKALVMRCENGLRDSAEGGNGKGDRRMEGLPHSSHLFFVFIFGFALVQVCRLVGVAGLKIGAAEFRSACWPQFGARG